MSRLLEGNKLCFVAIRPAGHANSTKQISGEALPCSSSTWFCTMEIRASIDGGPAMSKAALALIQNGFKSRLTERGYQADRAQQAAIESLALWFESWSSRRTRWFRKQAAGIYLWGGVGRGKSFVMDAFFASVPIERKRRVHFHAFLQELQQRMRRFAGQPDPLVLAIKALATEVQLLCFDEFHVHDIGDAMLLRRLLDVLVDEGVGLVMTSNYSPDALCPNPLYRERFVRAIRTIERRFTVISLDGGTDYREQEGYCWGHFVSPESDMPDHVAGLLGLPISRHTPEILTVNQHPLRILGRLESSVWVWFEDICGQAHSTSDYLWLTSQFSHIALSGVPPMADQPTDACQRFINFVDIAYDKSIRLVMGSDSDLDTLCMGSPHQDFARTRSRLKQLKVISTDGLDAHTAYRD
jgi:cell division protein ZapE